MRHNIHHFMVYFTFLGIISKKKKSDVISDEELVHGMSESMNCNVVLCHEFVKTKLT